MQIVEKLPRELVLNDQIVISEPGQKLKTLKVTRVEHYACSQHGTHINGQDCYTWSIPVRVTQK